jgi:hypothetical protein
MNIRVLVSTLFMVSIFLPHPFYNFLFLGSFALEFKRFDFHVFARNRAGWLFITYFFLVLAMAFFNSNKFSSGIVETSMPLLLLPFYIACLSGYNYLRIFPLAAFVLSLWFFLTSVTDISIYTNIAYLSFDKFSKYLHPVYFSYLLFFSLVYVELQPDFSDRKNLFRAVFATAIICSGSKLIICLAILFYLIQLLPKQSLHGGVALFVLLGLAVLFGPTRQRFAQITELDNLSILKADSIRSHEDSRLNGLTLRLILWQESLLALETAKDFMVGKGVGDRADNILRQRLAKKGLEKGITKYDPHNQFVTSFYKMGALGLLILLVLCFYLFKEAAVLSNRLLFYTVLLFVVAMLAESVLQRVVGIYFFTTVLLMLSGAGGIKPNFPVGKRD